MYSESVLKPRERVHFDPSNNLHVEDYAMFLKNSNWKDGCKYLLEQPFQDIPTMINNKLIRHFLSPYIKKD
jgi:hypothetical protein